MNWLVWRQYNQLGNDSVLVLLQILLLCLLGGGGESLITGLFNPVKSADGGKHLFDVIW